jgi:hypothetical protein
LATGVLIDRAVPEIRSRCIRRLLIALLGIYSHAIMDALAALTYHPPEPPPGDRFWLGYHAGLAALSLSTWSKNQQEHKWAMICSVFPDLDWALIKIPGVVGIRKPILRRPVLHETLFRTIYWLPLVRLLNGLPNLREKKVAVILELILYVLYPGRVMPDRPIAP